MIIANWKMNMALDEAHHWLQYITQHAAANRQWMCCPVATQLSLLSQKWPQVIFGGQDCSMFLKGAHTGSISAAHLKESGATHVIVGHSETRHHISDEIVQQKAQTAISETLLPIICVGENAHIHENKGTVSYIISQIQTCTKNLTGPYYIAYEPIWSIGSGRIPSRQDLEILFQAIRQHCNAEKILYGGSVTSLTIKELSGCGEDGFLVGGASLEADSFLTIINHQQL